LSGFILPGAPTACSVAPSRVFLQYSCNLDNLMMNANRRTGLITVEVAMGSTVVFGVSLFIHEWFQRKYKRRFSKSLV
jgi:hypothetical protein